MLKHQPPPIMPKLQDSMAHFPQCSPKTSGNVRQAPSQHSTKLELPQWPLKFYGVGIQDRTLLPLFASCPFCSAPAGLYGIFAVNDYVLRSQGMALALKASYSLCLHHFNVASFSLTQILKNRKISSDSKEQINKQVFSMGPQIYLVSIREPTIKRLGSASTGAEWRSRIRRPKFKSGFYYLQAV